MEHRHCPPPHAYGAALLYSVVTRILPFLKLRILPYLKLVFEK